MSASNFRLPYSSFAPPGSVQVSPAAFTMAKELALEVARKRNDTGWSLCFEWGDSRRIRRNFGPQEELGPGLDLNVLDAGLLPDGVLQTIDELTFAIRISRHIYEASQYRLIDVDPTAYSKLTLR